MPNLLAMSFEGELAPSFDLKCLQPGRTLPVKYDPAQPGRAAIDAWDCR